MPHIITDKPKLYLSAITAKSLNETAVTTVRVSIILVEANFDLACEAALDRALNRWPEISNWYDHTQNTLLVPQDLIDEVTVPQLKPDQNLE